MALQTVLEKLQIKDEKNILVQGLPSSIEKQFIKLNFSKSVTPLLKSRGIDLALVFAISKKQLTGILRDVLPALHDEGKLWIAYPKPTSKIASDLCRDCRWKDMSTVGFDAGDLIALDSTWCAISFLRCAEFEVAIPDQTKKVNIPGSLKNGVDAFDHIPVGKKITSNFNRMEQKENLKGAAVR